MADSAFQEEFPLLTKGELGALEAYGKTIRRQPGETLFHEGEQTDFALLIQEGHVKVMVGKPPRTVAIRTRGEFVGEMAAVRKAPRSATVIAFSEVKALFLPANKWLQFLYEHPRAMHAQLIASEERTEQATKKIVESDLAIERQLAKAFVELVEIEFGIPGAEGIELRLSQLDLASLIGASKLHSVKKVIRTFKEAKLISTSRQVTTLLDPEVLRDIANGDTTASALSGERPPDVHPPA